MEGLVRGFLVLGSLDGANLASGDLIQTSQGDRVTTRLVFHFKDGSIQDETAVFTQGGRFRLLTDHVIQRGPSRRFSASSRSTPLFGSSVGRLPDS